MEEEKEQKFKQKIQMKKEYDELLQRKKEQKDFEKQLSDMTREESKKLMEENAKQELERERQYKKHFEDYEKLMSERSKIHLQQVASTENAKSHQLHEWIHKNEEEYQEKLKEKEKELNEWRKNQLNNTYKEVKAQLEIKEQEKMDKRRSYPVIAEENIKLTQANKDYRQKLMQEKMEQQKAYSDILSTQMRLKEEIFSKYGTMTEQERKMNNKNLSVFSPFLHFFRLLSAVMLKFLP